MKQGKRNQKTAAGVRQPNPQYNQDENPINLPEETRVVYAGEINPHDG